MELLTLHNISLVAIGLILEHFTGVFGKVWAMVKGLLGNK